LFAAPENSIKEILISWGIIAGPPIITFFVGFFVKRWHIRYQAFINAAIDFKVSFVNEIRLLEVKNTQTKYWKSTYDILTSAIEKHTIAAKTFELYLGRWKRYRFNKRWIEYAGKDYPDILIFDSLIKYSTTNNPSKESEIRKLAIDKIKKLLKFAKHKFY